MKRAGAAPPAAGFTLVEILVAIAILAVAMAIVAGSFTGTLRVQEAADRRTATTHAARTALDRIVQDLVSAAPGSSSPPPAGSAAGTTPAPAFSVEDGELEGAPHDRLTFLTYGRPLGSTERGSDRALVEYEVVVSDDRRDWRLVRRQLDRPPLEPSALAEVPADVLAEGVVAFDVHVYDDQLQRKSSWRETAKLPLAVEVTLRVARDPERALREGTGSAAAADTVTYGTRLVLPLAGQPR